MALLHGTELNIAPDGSVDWGEDFLSGFDICVASIHSEDPIPKHMNLQVLCLSSPVGAASVAAAVLALRQAG